MPFGQITVARGPDSDDRQGAPACLLGFHLQLRGKLRIRVHKYTQSLRLARAEPVYQVVQVVIVVSRSHKLQSKAGLQELWETSLNERAGSQRRNQLRS